MAPYTFTQQATTSIIAMDRRRDKACGVSRWERLKQQIDHLSPAAFAQMMRRSDVVLLDVRRPDEFASGHLPHARNLDYLGEPFIDELEQLDRTATYLVYCNSGRRSLRTCVLMCNSGFQKVYNLDGGLRRWLAASDIPKPELVG